MVTCNTEYTATAVKNLNEGYFTFYVVFFKFLSVLRSLKPYPGKIQEYFMLNRIYVSIYFII